MTAASLVALFAVWVVAVISPGPDVVVVLQRSLAGRRYGVATAAGVLVGISVWLVAAFAGVAALVRVYPQIMTVLQVAGGLLLAALGVLGLRAWWASRTPTPQNPLPPDQIRYPETGSESGGGVADPERAGAADPEEHGGAGSVRADFVRGLLTNLANPKALVFFGAVLTPFLRDEVQVAVAVVVVVGLIAVAAAWFCGLAVLASHRVVNERLGRLLPWIDLGASALFVVVGVAFVIGALV